jgi:hypothetical protein
VERLKNLFRPDPLAKTKLKPRKHPETECFYTLPRNPGKKPFQVRQLSGHHGH